MLRRPLVLGLLGSVLAGCTSDHGRPPEPPAISLDHLVQSGPLPVSASEEMAILDEHRACVLDSYEDRIVCGNRRWAETVYLGRKGRGPGEIQTPGPLLRMPDGGLAYYDFRNARLTLYTPDLQFVGHLRLPSQGQPVPPITADSLLLISNQGFSAPRGPTGELQLTKSRSQILIFDIAANTVVASMPYSIDFRAPGIERMMAAPIQRDSTRLLLRGTGDHLLWLSSAEGKIIGSIAPPQFDPGMPDTLDIEDLRADLFMIFGAVREQDVESLRRQPRHLYPREHIAQIDQSARLWVLTNRRGQRGMTFLDVYDKTEPLGSLPVPGRVVAFRILDSILVTMTRDSEEDGTGIRPARLNWYRITDR